MSKHKEGQSQRKDQQKAKTVTSTASVYCKTSPILALKRLYSEYKYIQLNPLSHVSACPAPIKKKTLDSLKTMNIYREMNFQVDDERDFMLWHVNIRGNSDTIYDGVVFHGMIKFTDNYPMEPPTIRLCTRMEHPNVVDSDRICLDFLEKGEWKPIYSVHSILMQLQTFLYDGADVARVLSNIQDPKTFEEKKEEYLSAQEWSMTHAKSYVNRKIGHSNHLPSPSFVTREEDDGFKRMNCEKVEKFLTESDSLCFFTKTSDLVGYGINCKKRNEKAMEICSIDCCLEVLSLRAFMNYNVRGMSKDKPSFTHWIPIINDANDDNHIEKVIHVAKSSLANLSGSKAKKIDFSPEQVVKILPRLISNCLLQIIDQREKSTNAFMSSLRLFNLMIELSKEITDIDRMINNSIDSFIKSDDRSKEKFGDLLDFILLIPFSKFDWKDLYNIYMREFLTRYVKKILKSYKEIADFQCTEITDNDRISFSFKTIRKRLKELLLHIYFVQIFSDFNSVERISTFMKENCGILPYQSIDSFIEKLNQIEKMNDFTTFFKLLNEMSSVHLFETPESIIELIKSSIHSSLQKGYHGKPPTNLRKQIVLEELPTFASEEKWKIACSSKWRISRLPYYMKDMKDAWKQLYLQKSMSKTLREMAERNNFILLIGMISNYSECKCLETYWFNGCEEVLSKIINSLPITTIVLKCWDLDYQEKEKGANFTSLCNAIRNNYTRRNLIQNLIFHDVKLNANDMDELFYSSYYDFAGLKTLDLSGNKIGDNGGIKIARFLKGVKKYTNLTYLDLSNCDIGEKGTLKIGDCLLARRNLKTFKFTGNNSPPALFSIAHSLSYSTAIENVKLNNTKGIYNGVAINPTYTDSFQTFLQEFACLKRLDISNIEFPNIMDTIVYMYCQSLEEFNMSGCPCEPSTLKNLFMYFKVKSFNLSRNNLITNEKLDNMIENIVIQKGGWPKMDVSQKIFQIEELNLSETNIQSHSPLKRPLASLLKYSHITKLNVSKCSLQTLDLDTISEALLIQNIPKLKHLIMRQNKFKRHDLRTLVIPLQESKTLETLDISGNRIGEIGTRYISSIIQKNESIKYLNMFGCMIDVQGVSNLLEGIKKNGTIEILDLGLNKIRNKGFSMIIEMLKNSPIKSIRKLSLSNNNLNNEQTFAEAVNLLHQNEKLWINLKNNRFVTKKISIPRKIPIQQLAIDQMQELGHKLQAQFTNPPKSNRNFNMAFNFFLVLLVVLALVWLFRLIKA